MLPNILRGGTLNKSHDFRDAYSAFSFIPLSELRFCRMNEQG